MADNYDHRSCEGGPGMIEKAAHLEPQEVTEAELRAINKLALVPLTADQVFTFKAVLCDNELDRSYERFNLKALQDLKKLFLGKTVIKDHKRSADNQVARIYATELVQTDKAAKGGELYTQLVARCYMVRTASNADLIAEIQGGIKKEGSVGCAVTGAICSVCGTDNTKSYCPHWPGRSYSKDALEAPETPEAEPQKNDDNANSEKAAKLALRARVAVIRATHHTTNSEEEKTP